MATDYRFSQPFVVRLVGALLVALGVLVFALTLATTLLGVPLVVLPVGVAVVLLGVFGAGLWLRAQVVVRLGESGYQVRLVRGAGVRRAAWTDVEDVVATRLAKQRCVVLRLRDGRSTTIDVDVLGVLPDSFVRDLQQHLDRGQGYRPIG